MKNSIQILYLFLFLFSASSIVAQPSWQWGKNVRLISGNIAVDNMGNSYVTWPLQDIYNIDGHVLTSQGLNDIALTSFDCNGNYRWTKTIGGPGGDSSVAVRTDSLGGVYLVGTINAIGNWVVNISNDTIFSGYSFKGMFLVKYDTNGDFQWFRMPEDTATFSPTFMQLGRALDMDVAPNGDCYIYSRLSPGTYGNGAFEATYYQAPPNTNNGEDIYALKYDRNGNCTGGIHLDMYYSGAVLVNSTFTRDHLSGRIYASGYNRNLTDTIMLSGTTIDRRTGYIISFNDLGNLNWVKTGNDTIVNGVVLTSGPVGKLVFDPSGNIYTAGGAGGSYAGFGDFTFINPLGDFYGFPVLFKFSPSGELLDATSAAAHGETPLNAAALAGNVVGVVGSYGKIIWGDLSATKVGDGYNLFLARFNTDSFSQPISLDTLQSSPASTVFASYLVSDNQGNFLVAGRFSSTLYVADDILYNQTGTSEGFIAKFGSDSCYCPTPVALFSYDTIPNQDGYSFAYTGTADIDSVIWDFGDGETGYGINPSHLFAQAGDYTVCATVYNHCGTDSVCITIAITGPDAVKVINGFEEIRLYPNPALESLNIANALPGTHVDVINAVGLRLYSSTLQAGTTQIDISALPPGMYLLQLTDSSGKRGFARFVKQ